MRNIERPREVVVYGKTYYVNDPIRYKYQHFVIEEQKVIAFTYFPVWDEEEQAWYVSEDATKNHRNHQIIGYAPDEMKGVHDRDTLVFVEFIK